MSSRLNSSLQLMSWLILHPRENIRDRSPYCWIINPRAGLPQYAAFVGMVNQYGVHGKLAAFIDEGLSSCRCQGGIAATNYKAFVAFKPAKFKKVGFCAWRTNVRYAVTDNQQQETGVSNELTGPELPQSRGLFEYLLALPFFLLLLSAGGKQYGID